MSYFIFVEHCDRDGGKEFWARSVCAESLSDAEKRIKESFPVDPYRKGCVLVRLEAVGLVEDLDQSHPMYQKACDKAERLARKP